MTFADRWARLSKKSNGWATKDNDVHNNGGSIIPFGGEHLVSVWADIGGIVLSARTEQSSPKTLDEAMAMAEELFKMLKR